MSKPRAMTGTSEDCPSPPLKWTSVHTVKSLPLSHRAEDTCILTEELGVDHGAVMVLTGPEGKEGANSSTAKNIIWAPATVSNRLFLAQTMTV